MHKIVRNYIAVFKVKNKYMAHWKYFHIFNGIDHKYLTRIHGSFEEKNIYLFFIYP